MVSCSVPRCDVTYRCNPNKYTFHRFPTNTQMKEKWLRIINKQNWTPRKNSMVCSKHFKIECFVQRSKRCILRKDSLPTLFISQNIETSMMVNSCQYDGEDVVTTQQLSVGHSPVPENSATAVHSVHIKQEDYFNMKSEYEYDEVPIKQEIDVEPTVLQPMFIPRPSSPLCQPGTSRQPVPNLDSSRIEYEKMKSFTEREIHMVMNVYKYVQSSWPKDEFPHEMRLQEKTASILGISVSSVCNIVREYSHNKIDKDPLATEKRLRYSEKIDDFDKNAIKRKILSFYMNGKLPTMQKVYQVINEDKGLPDFKWATLRSIIKYLKFKSVKLHGDSALIDSADVVISRRNYLKKIKECRKQKRPIFYAGQTWIDTGHTVPMETEIKRERQDFMETSAMGALDSNSRSARLTVVHIGNESGFVDAADDIFESTPKSDDDHYDSLDAEHFEKWFEKNLPKLGQNAVVVMDKTPYNSRLQEKIPTAAWKKVHIQAWLRSKEIRFDEEEVATELLEKVKEAKAKFQSYAVDELAKKYNVEVLRLPPYHYELNPLELVWVDVKQYVATSSASLELEDMEDLIRKALRNVTAEKWRDCVQHALKEEDDFYSKVDDMIDKTIDSFDFNGTDSESNCSDLESDDSCYSS